MAFLRLSPVFANLADLTAFLTLALRFLFVFALRLSRRRAFFAEIVTGIFWNYSRGGESAQPIGFNFLLSYNSFEKTKLS